MADQSVDELIFLFEKYKITIDTVFDGDTVHLERFGIVIPFSQREIVEGKPKSVCAKVK